LERYRSKAGFVNALTRREISARLRALVGELDVPALADTARRLGVDERTLRTSLDETSPFPTIDVLIAFVTAYGIDPTWLLSGVYDAGTHRRVMDADPEAVEGLIRRLAMDATLKPTVSEPADEPRTGPG
jgi:lambda repressor-like predicted transcriptional regulator